MIRTVEQVRQVKIIDVVAGNDVRIRLSDEGSPLIQQVALLVT